MSAEEKIRRTLALYAHRLDDRDVEGVVALFARDGRLLGNSGEHTGHPSLLALWGRMLSSTPDRRTKHHLGASAINIQDETAEAVSDVIVFESIAENPWEVFAVGRYYDKFVPEDGEWRFAERRIESLTPNRSLQRGPS